MSDQARDDLVAAMEALRKALGPFASRLDSGDVMLTMPRGSAEALLALLDAEPVGYTLQREDGTFAGGFWLPRDIDHAEEEARKSWECGNNYSVAALYARPEASDE